MEVGKIPLALKNCPKNFIQFECLVFLWYLTVILASRQKYTIKKLMKLEYSVSFMKKGCKNQKKNFFSTFIYILSNASAFNNLEYDAQISRKLINNI